VHSQTTDAFVKGSLVDAVKSLGEADAALILAGGPSVRDEDLQGVGEKNAARDASLAGCECALNAGASSCLRSRRALWSCRSKVPEPAASQTKVAGVPKPLLVALPPGKPNDWIESKRYRFRVLDTRPCSGNSTGPYRLGVAVEIEAKPGSDVAQVFASPKGAELEKNGNVFSPHGGTDRGLRTVARADLARSGANRRAGCSSSKPPKFRTFARLC
jgi:hypothetical protein